MNIPRWLRYAVSSGGFLILLLSWQLIGNHYAAAGQAVLFPSPASVWSAAADYWGQGGRTEKKIDAARLAAGGTLRLAEVTAIRQQSRAEAALLGRDIAISFWRVSAGFLLAVAVGLPLGIFIGSFRIGESLLQPVTEFIRYVPVPALVPLLMVLFGIDETPKVMLIFIGTVFQLMLMVSDEVRRVPYEWLQACYTLGGTRLEAVMKVLVPGAMPGIFDALRLCNGWAWTWLIVAELVAANEGLGFRIVRYQRFLQTDKIFVYLIVLGLIGLLLDFTLRLLHRALFRWAEGRERA